MTTEQEKGIFVYRVQDKNGRGPFVPGMSVRWIEYREDRNNLLPFFVEFPHIKMMHGFYYGCACLDIAGLKRWFSPSEYTTLQKLGFRAVRLQVDAIEGESAIQCVFRRVKPLRKGVDPITLY